MKRDKHIAVQNQKPAAQPKGTGTRTMGYVYMVRNPSSNELSVCAYPLSLKRGTEVIAPSRYGLDFGVIVGSAIPEHCYCPGSTEVCGACLQAFPMDNAGGDIDDDLVASGEPDTSDILEEIDELEYNSEPEPEPEPEPEEVDIEVTREFDSYAGKDFQEGQDFEEYKDPIVDSVLKPVTIDRSIELQGDVDWIVRVATKEDHRRFTEYLPMEDDALRLCREKILKHQLDMKLVTAHYLFGEPKIIFFFTAASRVDFRDLVKDLVSVFRMRIELRQIGVRDEYRVLGGLAVCGRDFCCHCITDKLDPVSIKMAKEQNLSLNSTKISGPCGRLLCCLSYEYDFYCEEKQALPAEGSRLKVHKDLMKITEVNILSRKISLSGPEGRFIVIPFSAVRYSEEAAHWEIVKEYLDEFLPL